MVEAQQGLGFGVATPGPGVDLEARAGVFGVRPHGERQPLLMNVGGVGPEWRFRTQTENSCDGVRLDAVELVLADKRCWVTVLPQGSVNVFLFESLLVGEIAGGGTY